MSFLTLSDVSPQNFQEIIDFSIQAKSGKFVFPKTLADKNIGLFFEKVSTRTRLSFQVAISQLGGNYIMLFPQDLQISRGERIEETFAVFSKYLDGIVARVFKHETLETLKEKFPHPVINALSDKTHPCQILADIMTIQEEKNIPPDARVCFIGDGSSNVCNSLIYSSLFTQFEMRVCSPKDYRPTKEKVSEINNQGGNVIVSDDIDSMLDGADVIYTDVWVSMGQEKEERRRTKTLMPYQLNLTMLKKTHTKAIVMHCMPVHLGEEITLDILNSKQSRIIPQAENRLYTAKSLLHFLYSQ